MRYPAISETKCTAGRTSQAEHNASQTEKQPFYSVQYSEILLYIAIKQTMDKMQSSAMVSQNILDLAQFLPNLRSHTGLPEQQSFPPERQPRQSQYRSLMHSVGSLVSNHDYIL